MRKRILFVCTMLAAISMYWVLPRAAEAAVPTAYYVTPSESVSENTIQCSGTIQPQQICQLVLQSPIVPESVAVSVGDVVEADQVLVRVDSEQTEQLLEPLRLLQNAADNLNVPSDSSVDWSGLVSGCGWIAAAQETMPFSADALETLLGASSAPETKTTVVDTWENGEIKAPICGVVTDITLQEGVPAAAGNAFVTIADNRAYRVVAIVPEENISEIQLGDTARISGDGFSETYNGAVVKIDPTAHKVLDGSAMETVITVEIALEEIHSSLKSGFTAHVEILDGQDSMRLTLPYETVQQDDENREYVCLYDNGALKRQEVVTGREMTDKVEILSGVASDSIVLYPAEDSIEEGSMVHLKGRADGC